MDIKYNSETDTLTLEVATLREEISQLKNIIKNTDDIVELRKEITELKETIQDLTQVIGSSITELPKLQRSPLSSSAASSTITRTKTSNSKSNIKLKTIRVFPIGTQDDLDTFENSINEDNKEKMVVSVQRLIDDDIVKNLTNILTSDLILDFNLEGHHSKKRLNDYNKFMDVLYLATYKDGWTQKTFVGEMGKALKKTKNKHYKNVFMKRKKSKLNDIGDMDTEYVDVSCSVFSD